MIIVLIVVYIGVLGAIQFDNSFEALPNKMRILNFMGNSFGCSASGEHLVSAARDGYLKEAKYLLECNPRLAKYSTFRCSKFSSALFSSSTTE